MRDAPKLLVRRTSAVSANGAVLKVVVSDEAYRGAVEVWFPSDVVRGLGEALMNFPSAIHDKYNFHVGEEQAWESVSLTASAPHANRCQLDVRVGDSRAECSITFMVEAAALNRLGVAFFRLIGSGEEGFLWTQGECHSLDDLDGLVHAT